MGLWRRDRPRVNRMLDMDRAEVSRTYAEYMGAFSFQYDAAVRAIHKRCPYAGAILDVGTGPGFLPPRLAQTYPEAQVTGLDASPEMLAIARGRSAGEGLEDGVAFIEGSAYAIPLPDESHDLVVATNAIHSFDDLHQFTREARRVLRPGGHLIVLDERRDVSWPVYIALWGSTLALRLQRKPLDGMGPVIQGCYTAIEVDAALAHAGFERRGVSTRAVRLEAWAQA